MMRLSDTLQFLAFLKMDFEPVQTAHFRYEIVPLWNHALAVVATSISIVELSSSRSYTICIFRDRPLFLVSGKYKNFWTEDN